MLPMITMYCGKRLAECSNGEIVTALKWSKDAKREPAIFDDLLKEAVDRSILPDAMWLIQT